jgi:K(+)-stimulated pyrophosphate-energized sodium pump
VLTALALMAAYSQVVGIDVFNLQAPKVMMGLLIGTLLPFLFSALTMQAVGRTANRMVEEVRRQFREIPGIMDGTGRPDYARAVDISTQGALREMVLPGLLAVVAPVLVGFTMGAEALGGMLVGAIAAGFLLAVTMANAGGAWDNAKKYIEAGHHGGKGSEAHKAAVVGDTVGDPFKDTSGPSLNILLKLMSIVALVFAPLFISSPAG